MNYLNTGSRSVNGPFDIDELGESIALVDFGYQVATECVSGTPA